ncbi:NADH-cytochrome b5 reductase [Babesia caballi]|uniref:NADH-cytochrome b5 reductase n=1 Tax=Babesia caballi TaxID=5871 RepID=A0AAV4LSM5_BABCB|nr:NADH-cytochrome b5 reductase [Babesia caballi]
MAALRLNRPMAVEGKTDAKSLEASIRAAALLQRVVPILEMAQVLHHKSPVASVGRIVGGDNGAGVSNGGEPALGRRKPLERFHNVHEQEWRVLRPGMERETRHLRWRK